MRSRRERFTPASRESGQAVLACLQGFRESPGPPGRLPGRRTLPGSCLDLPSEAATDGFAELVAADLAPGDVILLSGPLGAGKSHFSRQVIRRMQALGGVPEEEVPSPTYTLVQTYEAGTCDIWHADLYRLEDEWDLVELGLEDAFREAVCLVEWPDRLGSLMPETALSVRFDILGDHARRAHLAWTDGRWSTVADAARVRAASAAFGGSGR